MNYLSAMGCLQPGWSSTCQWILGNEVASINLRAEAEQLHLSWRGGEREDVAEIVPIVHVPCNLGGTRRYFICPGDGTADAGCGRRVAKLYLARRRLFLCRHCSQLSYASPYEKTMAARIPARREVGAAPRQGRRTAACQEPQSHAGRHLCTAA